MLSGRRLLLGVSGGIAAYKAADLASQLKQAGAELRVVMTANAQRFVTPLTFRTLTNQPVATELWADPQSPVPHISLATWPELLVLVPATADLISRAAQGRADDLLTAILLDTDAPVLWAPAMNTRMWQHQLTQSNVAKLKALGHHFVLPQSGQLACGEVGAGRLAPLETIRQQIEKQLIPEGPLKGKRILLTAGPTREPWDAIRFLSNRSTGKMGYALAAAARQRGAVVTLVSGPVALPPPAGVKVVAVETAEQMAEQAMAIFPNSDVVLATAAVADFKPMSPVKEKLKKSDLQPTIPLTANPDLLKTMGEQKQKQFLVGFAAENQDPVIGARKKMEQKKCDMMIANFASGPDSAFGQDQAQVFILDKQGQQTTSCQDKAQLAEIILDHLEARLT